MVVANNFQFKQVLFDNTQDIRAGWISITKTASIQQSDISMNTDIRDYTELISYINCTCLNLSAFDAGLQNRFSNTARIWLFSNSAQSEIDPYLRFHLCIPPLFSLYHFPMSNINFSQPLFFPHFPL